MNITIVNFISSYKNQTDYAAWDNDKRENHRVRREDNCFTVCCSHGMSEQDQEACIIAVKAWIQKKAIEAIEWCEVKGYDCPLYVFYEANGDFKRS
jgi:hypothetical protein